MTIGKFKIYCIGFAVHTEVAVGICPDFAQQIGLPNLVFEYIPYDTDSINFAEALAVWVFPYGDLDADAVSEIIVRAHSHSVNVERFQTGKESVNSKIFVEKYAEYKKTHKE